MSAEHDKQHYDDVNTRSLALVGVISVILVFVAIMAVQIVYFRYEQSEYQRKVIGSGPSEADKVVATQKERITTGGTKADPENPDEPVRLIPISEAMTAVVADYKDRQEGSPTAARAASSGRKSQNESDRKEET